jgi:hypothetical protein
MSPLQALGGAACSPHSPYPCFRRQKGTNQKIERGGASTLGGRRFVNKHNNQPKIGCDGGEALLMRRDRGGTRGVDFFLSFWGDEWGDKKRGGAGLGLKRPPLAEPTQQPAENITGDGAT